MSSQSTVYAPLVAALVVLGTLLSSLVVPGVFTVDDNNYFVNVVMLRDGSVTLRNTAGLPPTNELLAFAARSPGSMPLLLGLTAWLALVPAALYLAVSSE